MVFLFPAQFLAARRIALACVAAVAIAAPLPAQAQDDGVEAVSTAGIAGEILDTAVDHCRRGESAQALSMFQAIRTQLTPPPAILRMIQDLEATGCIAQEVTSRRVLRAQVSAGWDSNVSQGINARSLVLGNGDGAIELELDESYRPRPSAFAQAAMDYSLVFPASGVNLQLGAGLRKNASAPAYDLVSVAAAASRDFKLPGAVVRVQVEGAEVWLGGHHYLQSQGGGMQAIRSDQDGAWVATLTGTRIAYVTQASQNATLWDLGLLREYRIGPAALLQAGFSLQKDKATDMRPGGDRTGYQLQAGAQLLAQGWRLRPYVSYTSWDSEAYFSPGLLDFKRQNRTTQLWLQAEKPLSLQTSRILEWRGRWSRDTVALYRYTAQVFTATLSRPF